MTRKSALPSMHGDQSSKDSHSETDELFGDAVIAEIATLAGLSDSKRIELLQVGLQALGTEIRRIISITPCDLPGAPSTHTHSERLDWVDAQLLNPMEKLLEALDPANRHMLSLWPNEVDPKIMPKFDELTAHLHDLQKLGWHLAITIAKYRKTESAFGPYIRSQTVAAAAYIIELCLPDIRPSRGTYDATTKQFHGVYPAIIRRIYLEITGLHEQLDRLIKEQVDQRR